MSTRFEYTRMPDVDVPARVPPDEVKDVIAKIQSTAPAGDADEIRVWGYLSPHGAMMVGPQAWALRGPWPAMQKDQYVGMEFDYSCEEAVIKGSPPFDYEEKLTRYTLSFLHYDTNVYERKEGEGVYTAIRDPIMRVYATDASGPLNPITPVRYDLLYDSGRGGHPTHTPDREERVELFQSTNLIHPTDSPITCDGAPRAFSIRMECDAGECGKRPTPAQYISDVQLAYQTRGCLPISIVENGLNWYERAPDPLPPQSPPPDPSLPPRHLSPLAPLISGWLYTPGLIDGPRVILPKGGFLFERAGQTPGVNEVHYQEYLRYEIPGNQHVLDDIVSFTFDPGDEVVGYNIPPVVTATYTDGVQQPLDPVFVPVDQMGSFGNLFDSHNGESAVGHFELSGDIEWFTDLTLRELLEASGLLQLQRAFQVSGDPSAQTTVDDTWVIRDCDLGTVVGDSGTIKIDLDDEVTATANVTLDTDGALSKSNAGFRYLENDDPTDTNLDGAVVRYKIDTEDLDISSIESRHRYWMITASQERQMRSTQEAVRASGDSMLHRSLSYVETAIWNSLPPSTDWLTYMLQSSNEYADGFVAGKFSLAFVDLNEQLTPDPTIEPTYRSEYTEREKINPVLDKNDADVVRAVDDSWSVILYASADRKFDAVPGWFQKQRLEGVRLVDDEELYFEWANWGCADCRKKKPAGDTSTDYYSDEDKNG
ncbi:MAG: hypothetical protein AAFV53_42855, partial [Myxococcota bacterium]